MSFIRNIKITWVLQDDPKVLESVPNYVQVIHKNSKGHLELKEIATSFCYVYNTEQVPNIVKRHKQLFIQTWHGDIPFKKIFYDSHIEGQEVFDVIDN